MTCISPRGLKLREKKNTNNIYFFNLKHFQLIAGRDKTATKCSVQGNTGLLYDMESIHTPRLLAKWVP